MILWRTFCCHLRQEKRGAYRGSQETLRNTWLQRIHARLGVELSQHARSTRKKLGRQLCRTKLPRDIFISKTKFETKSSKNAPKRPRKIGSPVQLHKNCSPALFAVLHPQFQNTISSAISNFFFTTKICRGGHAKKATTMTSHNKKHTSRS